MVLHKDEWDSLDSQNYQHTVLSLYSSRQLMLCSATRRSSFHEALSVIIVYSKRFFYNSFYIRQSRSFLVVCELWCTVLR
jgi:hypothetical protein